jgi:hypothetical protein
MSPETKKNIGVAVALMVLTAYTGANAQYKYPGQTGLGLGLGFLQPNVPYRVKPNVSDGFLNLRQGPGIRYDIMTRIPAGMGGIKSLGKCVPPRDNYSKFAFCHVEWQGFQGWISSINIEEE